MIVSQNSKVWWNGKKVNSSKSLSCNSWVRPSGQCPHSRHTDLHTHCFITSQWGWRSPNLFKGSNSSSNICCWLCNKFTSLFINRWKILQHRLWRIGNWGRICVKENLKMSNILGFSDEIWWIDIRSCFLKSYIWDIGGSKAKKEIFSTLSLRFLTNILKEF
jgi:hypothetical protein